MKVLECGRRSSAKNITNINCTKIQKNSNLYIIKTNLKLIKSYLCTTCFISELGFLCSEQNQTTVLSVGQTSMSCQWDLK